MYLKGACIFLINREFDNFNEKINNLNLKILEHGCLNAGNDWNFHSLRSPFNRLYFVISGKAYIKNKDNDIELKSGYIYLVPLNNTYDYTCNSYLNKFYIHFRLELLPGQDLFEGWSNCSYVPIDVNKIKELVEYAKSNQISELIKCKSIFLKYLSDFIKPQAAKLQEQMRISAKYAPIYRYILDNCFADLRVTDIAKNFNMQMSTLSKNFKNDTGLTLKRFIDNKIIQKAQEQLLLTSLPVKDIAFSLKFLDEFHFSKFFKKHVGICPNSYRQRNNTYK